MYCLCFDAIFLHRFFFNAFRFNLGLQMQSFMMGVIMGLPPSKDKELREHQKSQTELRGMSRKLAHVAGTSPSFYILRLTG